MPQDMPIKPASAVVIVPIYKPNLSPEEAFSLESICREFATRPIVVVKPRGLCLDSALAGYNGLQQREFDPAFFKGIKGYNRLMTSADFYAAFEEYEYMLVAQLDTYIFRDDLDLWCSKGYDYVGAPWLKRTVNCYPPMSWIKSIQDVMRRRKGLYSKVALYGKVGNGGLSLRRISNFKRVCQEKKDELMRLNEIGPKGQPEDVFWAQVNGFSYPSATEALGFSFDKYPAWCYKLTGKVLPMGCHGWYSRKMLPFWKKMLPLPRN